MVEAKGEVQFVRIFSVNPHRFTMHNRPWQISECEYNSHPSSTGALKKREATMRKCLLCLPGGTLSG